MTLSERETRMLRKRAELKMVTLDSGIHALLFDDVVAYGSAILQAAKEKASQIAEDNASFERDGFYIRDQLRNSDWGDLFEVK